MRDEDIEAFLAIVETGTITEAAESLYTTQSSISKRISSLERQLGTTLVVRGKGLRSVELTGHGERFLGIARRHEALCKESESLHLSPNLEKLSACSIELVNSYVLSGFYRTFFDTHENVRLSIHTHHSSEVYNMVRAHVVDIGIAYAQMPSPDVAIAPLYREPMVLVTHPAAKLPDPVSPHDLDPSEEVYLRWSREYELWHDRLFPGAEYRMHAGNCRLISPFLTNPQRWAITPVSVATSLMHSGEAAVRLLGEAPSKRTCYLVESRTPRHANARAVSAFKDALRDFIRDDPDLEAARNVGTSRG